MVKNQSKTLTLKNKNEIFQKFLSPSLTTTSGPRTPKNERIFSSNLHTHLIIEAGFFCPQLRSFEFEFLIWSLMSIMNRQSSIIYRPSSVFTLYALRCTLGTLPIITYSQIHSILTNKPKVKSAKNNVSTFVTSKYVQVRHLVIQTNKPKQTQFKPIQTQFKPNSPTIFKILVLNFVKRYKILTTYENSF